MFSPVKIAIAALVIAATTVQAAPTAIVARAPTFTKIFDGRLGFDDIALVEGPFGYRSLYTFTGGNLTDPVTGALVAEIITAGGGDLGIAATNGIFYADIRGLLKWTDGSYGFMEAKGSGVATGTVANTYVRFETNSTTYNSLESEFLLMDIDVTAMPNYVSIYLRDS